ncbi:hypothetical protein BKA83DRAFT_377855 [Pisolithus microcarpus]|nr:hypothetical protein BKA83DRAFT_377855 [Pisolithus microcarpus]
MAQNIPGRRGPGWLRSCWMASRIRAVERLPVAPLLLLLCLKLQCWDHHGAATESRYRYKQPVYRRREVASTNCWKSQLLMEGTCRRNAGCLNSLCGKQKNRRGYSLGEG